MAEASRNEKKNARRQAREQVFTCCTKRSFMRAKRRSRSRSARRRTGSLTGNDPYLRGTYLGVMAHPEEIDALIGRFAKGWKTKRLSRVSRAVLRLGTYELRFAKGVPPVVAINEAVELSKKFDDPRARAFVNRVLNAVKDAPADQLLRRSRLSSRLRCRRPMCRTRNKIHAVSGYAYLLGRY